MGVDAHRRRALRQVCCGVITVSDTRTPASDGSGARIRALLEEAGHVVLMYDIVRDEPEQIRARLARVPPAVQAVIVNGGTGLSPRDTTYEALAALFAKRLEGFGELFRLLSWQEIGPAAMLSRAAAGVIDGRIVFSVPGSSAAVELAMKKLILPELGHAVSLLYG